MLTVLYLCVDLSQYVFVDQTPRSPPRSPSKRRAASTVKPAADAKKDTVLLSLNRFERKKNIALAIDALKLVVEKLGPGTDSDDALEHPEDGLMLYIAGGYDTRVKENVDHLTVRRYRSVMDDKL
jgi:glycosyltransferase involved in cell wall biosynthesis